MTDEINNKIEQTGEQVSTPNDKPISIVEEARAIRDEIRQEREKLEAANAEAQKLQAESMLSGTSGGRVEAKPKEVDPIEYSQKALAGEIEDGE